MTVILLTAAAFLGGASFACFVLLLVSVMFRHDYTKRLGRRRLAAGSVVGSAAVIAGTIPFILNPSSSIFSTLSLLSVFFAACFAAGFLSSIFYRTVLPAVFVLYIAYVGTASLSLQLYAGVQRSSHQVRISESSVIIDGRMLQVCNGSSYPSIGSAASGIAVETFVLPDFLLLPVKKHWYRFVCQISSLPDSSDLVESTNDLFAVTVKAILSVSAVSRQIVALPQKNDSTRFVLTSAGSGGTLSFTFIPAP